MKKWKDPNYVVRVEKAIAKKYGEEAIQNPRKHWTEEKEKEYKEQLRKLIEKEDRFKGMLRRRLIIKQQHQPGSNQHHKGRKSQSPQTKSIGDPQILPTDHSGEQVTDERIK